MTSVFLKTFVRIVWSYHLYILHWSLSNMPEQHYIKESYSVTFIATHYSFNYQSIYNYKIKLHVWSPGILHTCNIQQKLFIEKTSSSSWTLLMDHYRK